MLQERKTQNAKRKTAVQNLKLFSFTLLLCVLTFALYASPVYAICDAAEMAKPVAERSADCPVCDAAEMAKPVAERSADCPAGLDQIEQVVSSVISVIVGLGFIAMLVLLVFTGIKYLTSGGEPKALQAAHSTLTWAILGIFLLAIAWLILQLVAAFTGIDTLTVFNVKVLCTDPTNSSLQFCKPGP